MTNYSFPYEAAIQADFGVHTSGFEVEGSRVEVFRLRDQACGPMC